MITLDANQVFNFWRWREAYIFANFSPCMFIFTTFFGQNNILLEKRLCILDGNLSHLTTNFHIISNILITFRHGMPITSVKIWLYCHQWAHKTMFVKIFVSVFKLAPSSFTYVTTLSHSSKQTNNSFNCTTMTIFEVLWTSKIL